MLHGLYIFRFSLVTLTVYVQCFTVYTQLKSETTKFTTNIIIFVSFVMLVPTAQTLLTHTAPSPGKSITFVFRLLDSCALRGRIL